ncbi:MAG: hypothetical protein MASP_00952 [Candidatus Methanolliviera sp. GoM_asphalt]|nr:MAG: hypothetical protein MASP_00952 [Candidatus Methanolliviera sp. GoM_asphalt]
MRSIREIWRDEDACVIDIGALLGPVIGAVFSMVCMPLTMCCSMGSVLPVTLMPMMLAGKA